MCAGLYSKEYHLVVCVHSWTKRMIPSSCVIRLEEKQWEEQARVYDDWAACKQAAVLAVIDRVFVDFG